ncbi:hypothetical protein [Burkholderia sp. KJ006]|uniref:hypothetical protein n=1 Tax=Burkholderia sp. KJ006 TaxID=416344 RepID=UPI0011D257D9|nr:hypothetical protein [Burkholderia sp. KJ006]
MKQEEVLIGIAERKATVHPLEPASLRFSLLQHDGPAFDLVLSNLLEEFPFLWNGREELTDFELEQFDRLFGWFVVQFVEFIDDSEKPEAELAKLLAVAATLDFKDQLWGEVYKVAPTISERLLSTLANLMRERHVNSEEILARAHLNADQIKLVVANVTSKNWKSLEWVLDHFWMDYRSPIKLQASAALYRYDRSLLQSLIENEHDLFEVASFVRHAPIEWSLRFALESKNWTLKFWAFHNSVRHAAHDAAFYAGEWETLLSEASRNPNEWSRWLAVLNESPARYPQIQDALGNSLSRASGKALDEYVNSISISALDSDRESVIIALATFRQKADLRERQRLWRTAFNKWEKWDFGCAEGSESLFRVVSSSLDFFVIGYLTECLDAGGRDELIAQLKVRSASIERTWHSDITVAMTERFKVISTYRVLAHAEAVSAGELDWLRAPSLVKPPWEDGSFYRSLRYDDYLSKPTFLD